MADPRGTYPPIEPWGTMAPMMLPRGGEPPEGWPAWRARKEAEARAAGMTGAATPPHPLSGAGLVNTALGFTPVGAAMDVAEAASQASRAPTWGEWLPAAGMGLLAAAGMVPGAGPAARGAVKAGKLAMDDASRLARADAGGFRRDMPVAIGRTTEGEQLATRPMEIVPGRVVDAPQAAARLPDGRTFTATNHYEAMEAAEIALRRQLDMDKDIGELGLGFITTNDRYVPRREGMEIAQRTRQDRTAGRPAGTPDSFREQYGIRSEDILAAPQPPRSSTVPIATTEPGLPGGEGIWGRLLSDHLQWPQAGSSSHRMPATTATPTFPPGTDVAWLRATNPATRDARGLDEAAVADRLRKAWAAGHDAVMLRNYTRPGGQTPETVIVVKDMNQLREPDARFDPAKLLSPNLSAGMAGIGIPGVTYGMLMSPTEERY